MRRSLMVTVLIIVLTGWILSEAQADAHGSFADRIQAAMDDASRPAADKARDANRMPKETLAFFGIDSNQRVLELLPGGGWYTRLLAPALDGTGQLYLGFAGRLPDELKALPFMQNVRYVAGDVPFQPTDHPGIFEVGAFDLGVRNLDAVLTFRNLHNLTPASRANTHKAAFDALAPGGVYGVIDHTRRHNEPDEDSNWRRLDPVTVILEVQAAGFDLDASSGLHARAVDELDLEVGEDAVKGRTDRFTLKFKKPGTASAPLGAPVLIE